MIKPIATVTIAALVASTAFAQPAPLKPIERFCGVAQLPRDADGFAKMRASGAGWQRDDIHWGNFDGPDVLPLTTDWIENHITAAKSAGVRVLPILDYMPEWLAANKNWQWTYANVRKVVTVTPDADERSGYKRHLVEYDAHSGAKLNEYDIPAGFCPPRDPRKWQQLIDQTVAKLVKPPYNVRYFQIWNEATPLTGPFWNGSIQRYVDEVHIPAAKAIRKHGGKVVWGGWPDCNTLAEYIEALEYNQAWKYTDILDVHYLYPAAFEYLWQRYVKDGKCEGIWMTEIGDSAHQTDVIPNQYPRMIYWALKHGWSNNDPDKYKVFYFSWDYMTRTTPEALHFGARPTAAARQRQLAELLGGETLEAFDDFTTAPPMKFSLFEQDESVEGFRSDDSIVLAFHIPQTYAAHHVNRETLDSHHMGFARRPPRYAVTLKGFGRRKVQALLHSIDDKPQPLTTQRDGDDLIVRFRPPARAGLGERRYVLPMLVFYIEVSPVKITGPARGRWGQSVACHAPGAKTWTLRRRGSEKVITTGDYDGKVLLPAAPDAMGNADGDFDLVFDSAPGYAHPIHIETRGDDRYTPRAVDLIGANAAPVELRADWLTHIGVRHARVECSWSRYEPREGEWNQAAFGPDGLLGRQILLANRYDMTILPLLAGIPDWAAGQRTTDSWPAPSDPEKWANFVDRVVGHYARPPYNQKVWQVWNEAPAHPFWPQNLTIEDYIEKVHNPAAKMIRKHGCKVVWGGWPATHWQGGQYAKALATSGAGELTDILSAHYVQGLRWYERGNWSGNVYGNHHGYWQTEMGWTIAENPLWLPRTFFQDLGWALAHDWSHKDKYRNYFFHYYAAQPNRGLYWNGPALKPPNGPAMRTLLHVARGDLALPGKKRTIQVQGAAVNTNDGHLQLTPILAGGRLVMLPIAQNKSTTATFAVALRDGEKAQGVKLVACMQGRESDVPFTHTDNSLRFELPAALIGDPQTGGSYVVAMFDKPLTTWN